MAHTKAQGTSKNLRDSKPKYLGVKLSDGGHAKAGSIIIRQRGLKYLAGTNVGVGKDHTLFAKREGKVQFKKIRKIRFSGKVTHKSIIHII